jgi:GNAT superfamily N-acetyltransferase
MQIKTFTEKPHGKLSYIIKEFGKDSEAFKAIGGDPDYALTFYTNMLARGLAAEFVAEENGEILGALAAIKGRENHSGTWFAVETFWFVNPFIRSRGVGTALLEAFEKWAKDGGCKYTAMIHMVDSQPEILKSFYEKKGYKLTELHYIKPMEG